MVKTSFATGLLVAALTVSATAQDRPVIIAAGDTPAVVLVVPENAKVDSKPNVTVIQTTNVFLIIRAIADTTTPGDAASKAADLIKNEVVGFQATSTNELTIAGSPAIHLTGTGVEADDGDPANADIVFFASGGHVFSACVHGEGNDAGRERGPMLSILQTAKAP